jgi:hypothetical protein
VARESLVSDIPDGDVKIACLYLQSIRRAVTSSANVPL